MREQTIAFIGAGNMAQSLIGGLLADGFPASRLRAADPDGARRDALHERWSLPCFERNTDAVQDAEVIVLAVKPQVLSTVTRDIRRQVQTAAPLLISIAAGIRIADIARWTDTNPAIVRVMPNTPALLGCGASGMFANKAVTADQHEAAEAIMRAVGVTVWLQEESQLDAVTAVSGSGPAYFFLLMELVEKEAARLGLKNDAARILTLQTALGAARMALESEEPVSELRRRVTSPGGTTEAALAILREPAFAQTLQRALAAACKRATELADEFGKA